MAGTKESPRDTESQSRQIFDAKLHPRIFSNLELKNMKEENLREFYDKLLSIESTKYFGRNRAEHKLIFLVGGPTNDVTDAKDSKGQPIYMNLPDHPKAPEITEAVAAISSYFEGNMGIPRVLSEIADIFHNLIALQQLDDTHGKDYELSMQHLADSLGFSHKDAYILAILKYQNRLIKPGTKNIKEEDRIIRNAITKDGLLPRPTGTQIGNSYRMLNLIGHDILKPRLAQIARMHDWPKLNNIPKKLN